MKGSLQMREATKVTVGYQYMRMILTQAAASGIAFVFGAVAFWYFTNINIVKQLISVVFMFVNFAFLYTASKKFAVMDGRNYTILKVNKIKGALFGAVISGINLVLMIVFQLLWMRFGTETGITGIFPTAFNAFFYLWSYPYNGIMNLENGVFTIYSGILMIILPILATLSGYIAGTRNINITDKLDSFVYEKEE